MTRPSKYRFTHSMPFPSRAPAVPLPCRAAKGLEWVLPIWFTQCGPVWFTLAMLCSCHALTMPWPWEERLGRGMVSVNQTGPHCVNQMGKTHSKPLAARNGRGTAWARHAMCESALECSTFKICWFRSENSVPLFRVINHTYNYFW